MEIVITWFDILNSWWMPPYNIVEFSSLMLGAIVLGAVIGAERQIHNSDAGIRTNALVCVGTCLFVALAFYLPPPWEPARIAGQVVSGIGFLGAGLIWRKGSVVQGLDTAATVFCTAAIGVLVGAGQVAEATIGAFAVLSLNIVVRALTKRVFALAKQNKRRSIRLDIWLNIENADIRNDVMQIAKAMHALPEYHWIGTEIQWMENQSLQATKLSFTCRGAVNEIDQWMAQYKEKSHVLKWTWLDDMQA